MDVRPPGACREEGRAVAGADSGSCARDKVDIIDLLVVFGGEGCGGSTSPKTMED